MPFAPAFSSPARASFSAISPVARSNSILIVPSECQAAPVIPAVATVIATTPVSSFSQQSRRAPQEFVSAQTGELRAGFPGSVAGRILGEFSDISDAVALFHRRQCADINNEI